MNMNEFDMDLKSYWEEERKRRLRHIRNQKIKDAVRSSRVELTIMLALLLGFFAFLYFWNKYQPLSERAAFIEGYYGVDHATAVAMAESEITNH